MEGLDVLYLCDVVTFEVDLVELLELLEPLNHCDFVIAEVQFFEVRHLLKSLYLFYYIEIHV